MAPVADNTYTYAPLVWGGLAACMVAFYPTLENLLWGSAVAVRWSASVCAQLREWKVQCSESGIQESAPVDNMFVGMQLGLRGRSVDYGFCTTAKHWAYVSFDAICATALNGHLALMRGDAGPDRHDGLPPAQRR
ncbi:hypothetical protein CGC20_6185 [Leishmania donovani]|uniref:Uncharacterized protein n=1 Tax=Leishmania donovani TaxID=5661 RepID=A0A504X4H2_LEIDO|nr:hypothetical protein CGC20_6185 [Leishmania donovani]